MENVNYFLLLVFISLSVSYIIDIYKTEPPKLFKLILFSTDLNFNEWINLFKKCNYLIVISYQKIKIASVKLESFKTFKETSFWRSSHYCFCKAWLYIVELYNLVEEYWKKKKLFIISNTLCDKNILEIVDVLMAEVLSWILIKRIIW